ncbi:sugar transferase [Fontimonas sp. SYSU GA230001]|uniref:sugar transferase n=1 Tax=Fontimonas sp. SYSU GA230001 TaxID=3142450 RepID=UPI0032B4A9BF
MLRRPQWTGGTAKRALDVVGAVGLAVALCPLIAVVCAVLLFQNGPVLFSHTRIGQGGQRFKVYKFRTMVPDAQQVLETLLAECPERLAEWERDQKLKDDPRVTRIGEFLRRTSMDELPQLINVLRGEMSLVGPRPIVDAELPRYGTAKAHYLALKPGLTGLWQVSGRNDIEYSRRVAMDRYYAQHASVWLDLGILLRTVQVVIGRRGAY